MLNRETFLTDPTKYRLANQGVAKISFPPTPEASETLRGELTTFVCDGAYADGLARTLEAFLGSIGRGNNAPAIWISGFFRLREVAPCEHACRFVDKSGIPRRGNRRGIGARFTSRCGGTA